MPGMSSLPQSSIDSLLCSERRPPAIRGAEHCSCVTLAGSRGRSRIGKESPGQVIWDIHYPATAPGVLKSCCNPSQDLHIEIAVSKVHTQAPPSKAGVVMLRDIACPGTLHENGQEGMSTDLQYSLLMTPLSRTEKLKVPGCSARLTR